MGLNQEWNQNVSRHTDQRQNPTETAGEHTEMVSPAPSDRNEHAPVPGSAKRRRKKTTEIVGEQAEVAGLVPPDQSLEVPAKGPPNDGERKREIQSQKMSRQQSRDCIERPEKHHRYRPMPEALSYPQSPSEPDALGNRSPNALLLANERQNRAHEEQQRLNT